MFPQDFSLWKTALPKPSRQQQQESKLYEWFDQLSSYDKQLNDGAKNLKTAGKQITDALPDIKSGAGQLADGSKALTNGITTYTDGIAKLSENSCCSYRRHQKLATGANALSMRCCYSCRWNKKH